MGAGLDLHGLRKDGTEFPLEISLSPVETDAGRLTIAAIRDSSARRKNEAKFRGLLEAAPDAMIVASRDGRIRLVNGQTERLFGYRRDELLEQPIEILVPSRFAAQHPNHREAYARDPHVRPMGAGLQLYGRRKDGSEFPVEISLSPLETEEGLLITSAVRDITDRKRLEENIRRQNQELAAQNRRVEEASRMKSEFLANMSHELRTPLNSIIGFAEMMHDGMLGPIAADHREYLGDILTSARHLLHLINDVLDLSKVESGTMEFFPEPVDLAALIGSVRDMVRPLASAKRIQIHTEVDSALTQVVIDAAKLTQVISNYLSNALKFTGDDGTVHIRARPDAAGRFRIEVEDNGVGIRPEDVRRLFVEFQQLDAGDAKSFQGTGLGLALTRRLVEAQGGEVGVSSRFGEGSLFYAVLPSVARDASAPSYGHAAARRAVLSPEPRIMVVDDDVAALKLLDTLLQQRGFRPDGFEDPEAALRAAAQAPPDLLILDPLMPGLSAMTFLKRFRAISAATHAPVIIWTVRDMTPIERTELLSVAQDIVINREGGASALLDCVRRHLMSEAPAEGPQ
jgi:protein-histidine pros-kinase